MKDVYKLYIGDFTEKKGFPASYSLYGTVSEKELEKHIANIKSQIREGLDIYILTPEGEVKAYYRDKLS